jgi:NADH-quinone oxidoreductase subunit J
MRALWLLLAAADDVGQEMSLSDSAQGAQVGRWSATMATALVILGLGAAGVYLMLPRGVPSGRRLTRVLGGLLAAASFVLLLAVPVTTGLPGVEGSASTFFWPLDDQPKASCWTFHILAGISLASALLMITSRNPVYSALWFAMVLLGNAGLFLLERAEFLMAATIVIYAGAIVVTFLFVIMLAQPTGAAPYDRTSREPFLAGVTGLLFSAALVSTLHHSARFEPRGGSPPGGVRPPPEIVAAAVLAQGDQAMIDGKAHVASLGRTLFLDHLVGVEVSGLILLAAVVGAMLIAGHRIEHPGGAGPPDREIR